MRWFLLIVLLTGFFVPTQFAQENTDKVIPSGAKLYVASMENGFDEYLKAAIAAKKVPVVVVDDRGSADFEISGHSETQKAGTAKKVIRWDWRSNEQAS